MTRIQLSVQTPPEPDDGAVIADRDGYAWQRDDARGYPHGGPVVCRWFPTWPAHDPSVGPQPWPLLVATRGPVTVLADTRVLPVVDEP